MRNTITGVARCMKRGMVLDGRLARRRWLTIFATVAACVWCSLAHAQWYNTYDFTGLGVTAYCPFETDVNDVTGNGNNPANSGVVIAGTGRFGNCAEVELTEYLQYVTLDFGASPATWAFWYRPRTVFFRGSIVLAADATQNYIAFGNDAGDPYIFSQVGPSPRAWLESSVDGVAGQWFHIALVVSPTTCKLYVNGILEAEDHGQAPRVHGAPYLGNIQTPIFWGTELDGDFDDFVVFNRILSSVEIAALARDSDTDGVADLFLPGLPVSTLVGCGILALALAVASGAVLRFRHNRA
jgi:hypothetical protein